MLPAAPAVIDSTESPDVQAVRALAIKQRDEMSGDFQRRADAIAVSAQNSAARYAAAQQTAAMQQAAAARQKALGTGAGTAPRSSTPGGPADFESTLAEVAKRGGLTPSQVDAMRTIAKYESSFQNIRQQITDVNSGGNEANGYWQITPGTFKGYSPQGDFNNQVDAGLAAFQYAQKRYGTVESVADRFIRQGHAGY